MKEFVKKTMLWTAISTVFFLILFYFLVTTEDYSPAATMVEFRTK